MGRISTWLSRIVDKAIASTGNTPPVQLIEYQGGNSETAMLFPYGMYANVPNDTLAVTFFVGGTPENKVSIAGTFANRPELEQGEIAIFRPDNETLIKFANSGDIEISTANNVTINATQSVTVNSTEDMTLNSGGDMTLTATGSIEITAGSTVDINGSTIELN